MFGVYHSGNWCPDCMCMRVYHNRRLLYQVVWNVMRYVTHSISSSRSIALSVVYYHIPYKYDNNIYIFIIYWFVCGALVLYTHSKVTQNAKDDNDEKMMTNPTKRLSFIHSLLHITQINNMRYSKSNKPKCDFYWFILSHSVVIFSFSLSHSLDWFGGSVLPSHFIAKQENQSRVSDATQQLALQICWIYWIRRP